MHTHAHMSSESLHGVFGDVSVSTLPLSSPLWTEAKAVLTVDSCSALHTLLQQLEVVIHGDLCALLHVCTGSIVIYATARTTVISHMRVVMSADPVPESACGF